jgi:hypothetical protein
MTCRDIHVYLASDPCAATRNAYESADFSEHLTACAECNRLIKEQKEVTQCLELVRGHVPALPASLDASVLARYRTYVAERSRPMVAPVESRIGILGALGWAAAVAFAVVVAYGSISLFIPGPSDRVQRTSPEPRPVVAPQPAASADRSMPAAREPVRRKPTSTPVLAKRTRPATPGAQPDNTFPARFQSLMYCDQLSCSGALDVIRVQLPSPVLGISSVSRKASGLVSAEVLVGPDGIARGIRVVE